MSVRGRRAWLAALGVAVAALGLGAPLAQAAPSDPLYVFFAPRTGEKPPSAVPPPGTGFNGPCGLAHSLVASQLYVSDYYHHAIDVFNVSQTPEYLRQLAKVDPLDGPCGLAFDSSERLYVNYYHRSVVRFSSLGPELVLDEGHPTGVAVDVLSDRIYVNDGTYIAVYGSSGAPVLDSGGEPLKIGLGDLEEGYGAAVVAGRVYVADAGTDTVKVYEPAVDTDSPVAEITGPGAGFNSLRDTAVAVDATTGKVYVVDKLQPGVAEEPEAVVDVFSSTNEYLGHLKYKIVDAAPPGLAAYGGTSYVTSGNTLQASVYAYGPDAETEAAALPATFGLRATSEGSGTIASAPTFGLDCAASCEEEIRSGADVTLTATPAAGSAFVGWLGGGCAGTGTCTVTMDRAAAVTASFEGVGSASSGTFGPLAGPPSTVPAVARRAKHRHRRPRHGGHASPHRPHVSHHRSAR